MKVLYKSHNNSTYEFRLLEQCNTVEIKKDGTLHYLIHKGKRTWFCNCPGAVYHHKCWHLSMLAPLFKQPSLTWPVAEWCEEAGEMQYLRR